MQPASLNRIHVIINLDLGKFLEVVQTYSQNKRLTKEHEAENGNVRKLLQYGNNCLKKG